ncbi:hypothetical protein Peur_001010 [Populus x canadensis]
MLNHHRSLLSTTPSLADVPINYTHVCDHTRFANQGMEMKEFGYCDSSLSFEDRAKDLVDRMTLDIEKVQQLGIKQSHWCAKNRAYLIMSGGPRHSMVSPMSAQVVSAEARAMYNLGRAGLTYWSPNINVVIRDPRWGRITETPGEDPFVVGTYASNYVKGLQDVEGAGETKDLNSRPLKVSTCCKHYAAYDVDAWLGIDRYHYDARVTEQDIYVKFPLKCVLKMVIYIVSDCDSIQVMVDNHKWLGDTKEDVVAQVLFKGRQAYHTWLDLDCGAYYPDSLQSAVMQGEVAETEIDKSLKYLYVVLMRLGFFDGSPFKSLGKDHVCSHEHI